MIISEKKYIKKKMDLCCSMRYAGCRIDRMRQ